MVLKSGFYLKLERSKDHIYDLKRRLDGLGWGDGNPFRPEDDVKLGQRVYYLTKDLPVPSDFALIIGDAVHNMRVALDHLAVYLVSKKVPHASPESTRGVYFPISESADAYRAALKGKVSRIGEDAVEILDSIEPYKGGKGYPLWTLHKLDISDKHNLLVSAAGTSPRHSMLPSERTELAAGLTGLPVRPDVVTAKNFQAGVSILRLGLKAGDELLRIPLSEVDDKMEFSFDIAFAEPKIVEGQLVLETLQHLFSVVRFVFKRLERAGLLN